jgi:hypothetical protein
MQLGGDKESNIRSPLCAEIPVFITLITSVMTFDSLDKGNKEIRRQTQVCWFVPNQGQHKLSRYVRSRVQTGRSFSASRINFDHNNGAGFLRPSLNPDI